jgi:hypothetical protein
MLILRGSGPCERLGQIWTIAAEVIQDVPSTPKFGYDWRARVNSKRRRGLLTTVAHKTCCFHLALDSKMLLSCRNVPAEKAAECYLAIGRVMMGRRSIPF